MSETERLGQVEMAWMGLWYGFLSGLLRETGLVCISKDELAKLTPEDLKSRLEFFKKFDFLLNFQCAISDLFHGKVTSENILRIADFFRQIDSKVALPKFLKELDEFSEKYSKLLRK